METEQQLKEIREACIEANPEKKWVEPCPCGCIYDRVESVALADVLLAIHALEPEKRPMYFAAGCDGGFYETRYTYPDGDKCVIEHHGLGGIGVGWLLENDNLTAQSPECIAFIHKLITV